MANGEWDRAIKLAAKFRSLGQHEKAILRAKDVLNNPELYVQLGHNLEDVKKAGIDALKDRFSVSWKAIEDSEDP